MGLTANYDHVLNTRIDRGLQDRDGRHWLVSSLCHDHTSFSFQLLLAFAPAGDVPRVPLRVGVSPLYVKIPCITGR
jgi:hypothetical protein